MTKEKLKTNLYEILDFIKFAGNRIPTEHYSWDNEKYDWIEALETALEQEPCEDAISRQAVMDCIDGYSQMIIRPIELKEYIDKLPSATSQPKIGHWKFVQRGKYIDICCSRCGFQRVKEYAYNYTVDQISEQDIKDLFSNSSMNFCENCGAKMKSEE